MGSIYKSVFEPIEIRGVRYKNRLHMAPQSPGYADSNGNCTDGVLEFFRPAARGGAAIITIGNSPVDFWQSKDEARHMSIDNDDVIVPLSRFTDMVHSYGCVASIEVNHSGQDAKYEYIKKPPIGPSPFITPAEYEAAAAAGREPIETVEMSEQQILDVINKYIEAAYRCKRAGFKMVMLHGGHANMIGQFSSPLYNRRGDKWGGSLKNRARFAQEIINGVRDRCGEDFVIEFRISAEEHAEGSMHFEETKEYIKLIEDNVDIFNVSAGIHADSSYVKYWLQPTYMQRMLNVPYAAAVKQLVKKAKVCAVGSIMNVKNAEEIISSGKADFVAMAREFVADPELPRKYATGREEDHVPCIRCGYCGKSVHRPGVIHCAVNPMRGHELQFPSGKLPKADEKKRVAVIGGGLAGITAARALTDAGHDVTIYEKSSVLGGNLIAAAACDIKEDIRDYKNHIEAQIKKLKARVLLNTEATPELIEKEKYDGIIIAVGAEPAVPKITGIDQGHVHWAAEADMGKVELGELVVIIGGGSIGLETALDLSRKGHKVTVIEAEKDSSRALSAMGGSNARMLKDLIDASDVKLCYGTKVEKINEKSVICVKDGETTEIEADTVLTCAGMKSRSELAESFIHCAPETEVFIVGDAVKSGQIAEAVNTAFEAAVALAY